MTGCTFDDRLAEAGAAMLIGLVAAGADESDELCGRYRSAGSAQVALIEAGSDSTISEGHDMAVPIGAWSRDDRPAPTLAGYHALLTGSEG
jgi:hypothetical protein